MEKPILSLMRFGPLWQNGAPSEGGVRTDACPADGLTGATCN
jgi:hypothetical protein